MNNNRKRHPFIWLFSNNGGIEINFDCLPIEQKRIVQMMTALFFEMELHRFILFYTFRYGQS